MEKGTDSLQYAYYVYCKGIKEPIEKIMYSSKETLLYKVKHPGKYKVKIFVRNGTQKVLASTATVDI